MPAHPVCNVFRAVCSTTSPIWSRCGIMAGGDGAACINYVCDHAHLVEVQRTGAFIPKFADKRMMEKLAVAVSQVLGTLTKAVPTCWQ